MKAVNEKEDEQSMVVNELENELGQHFTTTAENEINENEANNGLKVPKRVLPVLKSKQMPLPSNQRAILWMPSNADQCNERE